MDKADTPKKRLKNSAGVVLAGGRSSRMGRDKAYLDFNGRPLLDHMIGILEDSGLGDVYVSGAYEGYRAIPDATPGAGPAAAMAQIIRQLAHREFAHRDGVIFVPVDMPFLTPDILHPLLQHEGGAFYKDKHLPAWIPTQAIEGDFAGRPVMALFDDLELACCPVPSQKEDRFRNLNTPSDWAEATRS